MGFKEVLDKAFMELDKRLCEKIWQERSALLEEAENALKNISQSTIKNAENMEKSTKQFVQEVKLCIINNLAINLPGIEYESKNITSNIGNNINVDPEDPKIKHFCEDCGASFKYRSMLHSHVKSVHRKIKDVACKRCSATFSSNGKLTRHVNAVHLDIKRYACPLCEYAHYRKDTLETHIKLRHNTKKLNQEFICPECNLPYLDMARMKEHMRDIHRIAIPSIHDQSGSILLTENSNSQVISMQYNMDGHHCHFCGYASSNKATLDAHVKCLHIKEKNAENNEAVQNPLPIITEIYQIPPKQEEFH